MTEIRDRYLKYNAHAASYTWKYNKRNLDMSKTLQDNNIADDDEEFYQLSMNDDWYLQAIHLYFNDDLTEAWVACVTHAINTCTLVKKTNSFIEVWDFEH